MKEKLLTPPNICTMLRIVGTVGLLLIRPLTLPFYLLYTFCGITDVLDGTIARATNSTSEFGARLDSISDLIFYAVMIVKFFPILLEVLPVWMWYCIGAVLVIRACSYVTAAVRYHRFASLHTILNKATGFCVFCLPYMLVQDFALRYCEITCVIAGLASTEEFLIHLLSKEYEPGRKFIWKRYKKERAIAGITAVAFLFSAYISDTGSEDPSKSFCPQYSGND